MFKKIIFFLVFVVALVWLNLPNYFAFLWERSYRTWEVSTTKEQILESYKSSLKFYEYSLKLKDNKKVEANRDFILKKIEELRAPKEEENEVIINFGGEGKKDW